MPTDDEDVNNTNKQNNIDGRTDVETDSRRSKSAVKKIKI